jgi:hypothetical protein
MVSFKPGISPFVVSNLILVKSIATYSGYSLQFLSRLIRGKYLLWFHIFSRFIPLGIKLKNPQNHGCESYVHTTLILYTPPPHG